MAVLFGSRARGTHREDSDIDVLVTEEEAKMIPRQLLAENGGPIDAFYMPESDGWASAVGSYEQRMVRVFDEHEVLIEYKEIDINEVIKLALTLKQI